MRYLSAVLATALVLTASGALALMMDVFSLEPMHGKNRRCSLVPQQPVLSVLPVQQSYSAAIGSTQRSTFTVSNTGTASATNIVFDSFSSAAFSHVSSATNPCGTTLAAKSSCNKDVVYTGTSGTQTGTLVIESDQYPPTGYAELTGKGMLITVGDDFNRTNENPLSNGTWVKPTWATYAMQIVSNVAESASGGSGTAIAYWSGSGLTNDHCSQSQLVGTVNSQSPIIRVSSTANSYYYWSASQIIVRSSGSDTVIKDGLTSPGSSDVLKLCAKGSTITAYRNGSLVATITNTTLSTGFSGVKARYLGSGIDNWVGSVAP